MASADLACIIAAAAAIIGGAVFDRFSSDCDRPVSRKGFDVSRRRVHQEIDLTFARPAEEVHALCVNALCGTTNDPDLTIEQTDLTGLVIHARTASAVLAVSASESSRGALTTRSRRCGS
jgi:hypothetical protein